VSDFEVHPDGDRNAFLLGEVNNLPFPEPADVVELFLRPLDPAPRSAERAPRLWR
jgi:hypothetical protein